MDTPEMFKVEQEENKITIPIKNGIWEWLSKGFGFKKGQTQNG